VVNGTTSDDQGKTYSLENPAIPGATTNLLTPTPIEVRATPSRLTLTPGTTATVQVQFSNSGTSAQGQLLISDPDGLITPAVTQLAPLTVPAGGASTQTYNIRMPATPTKGLYSIAVVYLVGPIASGATIPIYLDGTP